MLGHWRVVLKQAEESARAGRLEEALALASQPDVAAHRQVVGLRGRLALELIGRASRRGQAEDLAGAIDDLRAAEKYGAPPDALAAARLALADGIAGDIRADLDAGEVGRVLERVEHLSSHKIHGPALRRLREAAEAWQAAGEDARRGEFGRAFEQLERAERLAGDSARAALASARRDLEARQAAAHPKVERLYATLETGQWGAILAAAEALLETVPEHPAARQARTRAWQQIGAISPSATLPLRTGGRVAAAPAAPLPLPLPPTEAEPIRFLDEPEGTPPAPAPTRVFSSRYPSMPSSHQPTRAAVVNPSPGSRFILWADGIGGYLVCLGDQVVLGRAGPDGSADVPLLGDLGRRHATIVRDGDGYVLRAEGPTFLNGRRIETAALRDGDILRLGPTLELEFRQPSPISTTARLRILSRHRLPVAVDGVILMGETCIVGAAAQAHVPAPGLAQPVVLYRQGDGLWCRAPGGFEVDGRPCLGRAALGPQSSVLGEEFSFSLEPLGSRTMSA